MTDEIKIKLFVDVLLDNARIKRESLERGDVLRTIEEARVGVLEEVSKFLRAKDSS